MHPLLSINVTVKLHPPLRLLNAEVSARPALPQATESAVGGSTFREGDLDFVTEDIPPNALAHESCDVADGTVSGDSLPNVLSSQPKATLFSDWLTSKIRGRKKNHATFSEKQNKTNPWI